MVVIKTRSEDFFEFLTKPDSDINSNQCVERPTSLSTPEKEKSESIDEKEKFSSPVSTPAEGSCDKLMQRLVSDLLRTSKTPPTVGTNAGLARFPSGGGNLTRPGQLHNPGQARLAARGPRPPVTRPGAPRMMKPVRPPGLGGPRPRATNPLEGPRPRATPRLVNVRSLIPDSHSSMAMP